MTMQAERRRSARLRSGTATFRFGTKAETLQRLAPRLRTALVPDLLHFTVEQWRRTRTRCLQRVAARFGGVPLAVRSSAQAEDGERGSMAGAFESVLKVRGELAPAVGAAIDRVAASLTGNPLDQILVQPMLDDVAVSGVIMTHDLVHGAPYYVLNFDDESGQTDSVTAGRGVHKALRVYRNAAPEYIQSPRVARFLGLARELERLCGDVPLDIEFALTRAGELYLLQVRRIASAQAWHPVTERRVSRQLVFVENFVRDCGAPRDGLFGRRTILAVMPDWNPAEIIGTNPRPLATSLYRELVTREVWRDARAFMGYRRLPPEELMVVVNSHPYVDVRASFNSFLPAGMGEVAGHALVDAWLDRLDAQPELHDKVEFEIAHTCLDLDFDRTFSKRYAGVLTRGARTDYRDRLRMLTSACLRLDDGGSLAMGQRLTQELEASHPVPAAAGRAGGFEALRRAVRLVRDCARTGTFAFAVVARHAFIAEALLRSAVRRGALAPERLDAFRRSIATVTSGMLRDYDAVCRGEAPRAEFLARYGHLRPGTYDITSRRYDARDDLFAEALPRALQAAAPSYTLRYGERSALRSLLVEAGLPATNPTRLLAYARRAIAGREHAKFVFTRCLSDALEALADWGESQGLSRDDLSFVDWPALERSCSDPVIDYADRHFLALAEQGRQRHADAHAFRLSHIVRDVRDIYVATIHRSEPNFIGTGSASGRVVALDAHSSASVNLFGCIVCIENADPGFDWVFTRGIVGLVTKFGGANSHMAIRCAELGLPAAIGCGEQTYGRLVAAGMAELNCAAHALRPTHEVGHS
ncbi:MAG: PEP/pyruvate-binding domain-containing protein [Betaproteobacteria bacterium]